MGRGCSKHPRPEVYYTALFHNLETSFLTASNRLLYSQNMKKNAAAVALGRRGGQVTAKRGSEYFRQIAAQRKTKAGGRPPKEK
jgi:hypothetical protein